MSEGILFESDDCHSLETAIRTLLDDVALRERLGKQGRKKALGYDWEPLARKIEQELIEVST